AGNRHDHFPAGLAAAAGSGGRTDAGHYRGCVAVDEPDGLTAGDHRQPPAAHAVVGALKDTVSCDSPTHSIYTTYITYRIYTNDKIRGTICRAAGQVFAGDCGDCVVRVGCVGRGVAFRSWARRKHPTVWSFTMPTACMNA